MFKMWSRAGVPNPQSLDQPHLWQQLGRTNKQRPICGMQAAGKTMPPPACGKTFMELVPGAHKVAGHWSRETIWMFLCLIEIKHCILQRESHTNYDIWKWLGLAALLPGWLAIIEGSRFSQENIMLRFHQCKVKHKWVMKQDNSRHVNKSSCRQ